MTRLIHLTDLHFGLHRTDLVTPLRDAVLSCKADAVVVSGDLTQRARPAQFRAAMTFLTGLNLPFLAVPGNHDVPLFNPVLRLFDPFGRYRRGALRDMTPGLRIGRLRLFGINTADPLVVRGGIARPDQIDRVCTAMRQESEDVTNILVAHHPFEEPPDFVRGETKGAPAALQRMTQAGLQVILSGHLHHWTTGLGIAADAARPVFQLHGGTALCARLGEQDHGFAVLDFAADARLTVTAWMVDEGAGRFVPRPGSVFARRGGGWVRAA